MFMRCLIIALLALLTFSCNQRISKLETRNLEPLETLQFELDSLTPDYFHGLEPVKINKKNYLTFLNDLTNAIYYYDFQTKELERILNFVNDPDGIDRGIMSYSHIGEDSIFLFGKKISSYMVDLNGQVIDKYDLLDLSLRQSLYSTSNSPAIFLNNEIYYNSLVWGMYERDYYPILKYSLENQRVELSDPLPEVYFQEGDWGKFWFDYAYQVFDKSSNRIIYSFPASNSLFVRIPDQIGLQEIKSDILIANISPPFKDNNYIYDSKDWNEAMNSSPIFNAIFIDNTSNQLLRVFIHPVNSPLKDPKRKISLIKYDLESLQPTEILNLPDNEYKIRNSFFLDSYFYVRKNIENEDVIEFEKFSI